MTRRARSAPDPVGTRERVREVLAGTPFRRFFAARAVSQFGDGLFQLSAAAVLLFERKSPNPVVDLLVVSAVTLVPFSAVAPFVGVFIDRWERHKILTRVPLGRAAIAAMLPIAALAGIGSVPFYAVVLVVLSANRFFLATMSAVLPQLVPSDDLLVANSVATTGGAVANVAGQAVGSALAAGIGGVRTALFAAAAFAGSAAVARLVPAHRGFVPRRAPLADELREVVGEMTEGIRRVGADRRVVFGLTAVGVLQVLVGGMIGVLVHYYIAELDLDVGSAFVILAVLAAGIGVGVVLVPVAGRRVRHDLLIPSALVIAAAGTALAAVNLHRFTLIIAAGVVGIAYAFAKIPVDTIVQQEMADEVRGRAFSLYDMLFNVARVGGVAIIAVTYQAGAGTRASVAGISVAFLVFAGAFALWERRLAAGERGAGIGTGRGGGPREPARGSGAHRRRDPPGPGDALVPGEMVSVRSYAGSRADEQPRAITVGDVEIAVDEVVWRALEERDGVRRRIFVVRAGGKRVRLSYDESASLWEIERAAPPDETTGNPTT